MGRSQLWAKSHGFSYTGYMSVLALKRAAQHVGDFQSPRSGHLVNQHGFARSNTYRSPEYRQDAHTRVYVTGRPEFILERSDQWLSIDGPGSGPTQSAERFATSLKNRLR